MRTEANMENKFYSCTHRCGRASMCTQGIYVGILSTKWQSAPITYTHTGAAAGNALAWCMFVSEISNAMQCNVCVQSAFGLPDIGLHTQHHTQTPTRTRRHTNVSRAQCAK